MKFMTCAFEVMICTLKHPTARQRKWSALHLQLSPCRQYNAASPEKFDGKLTSCIFLEARPLSLIPSMHSCASASLPKAGSSLPVSHTRFWKVRKTISWHEQACLSQFAQGRFKLSCDLEKEVWRLEKTMSLACTDEPQDVCTAKLAATHCNSLMKVFEKLKRSWHTIPRPLLATF